MQDSTIILLSAEAILAVLTGFFTLQGQTSLASAGFGALVGIIGGHLNGRQSGSQPQSASAPQSP